MNADYATKTGAAGLKTEVANLRVEVLERLEKLETRLLTEFHNHARATESRMHAYEVKSASLALRLAAIETRVRELESKL